MPRKNIVWLASYPKSGNTWARVFLANYLFNMKTPMPINQVHRLGMGDSVMAAYRKIAGRSFDPTDIRTTLALRPKVLAGIVANGADVNFVKTHSRRGRVGGVELMPPELTRSAVYILRDPVDVALSYAAHYGMTPADAVEAMAREDNAVVGDAGTTTQFLGSWSGHVESWTRTRRMPVLTLRYEDMETDPKNAFTRLLQHIGVPADDDERLERAIRFSSFGEMRRQEDQHGFVERSARAERFFVGGRSGRGRAELAADLIARLEADHGAVMREFGYL